MLERYLTPKPDRRKSPEAVARFKAAVAPHVAERSCKAELLGSQGFRGSRTNETSSGAPQGTGKDSGSVRRGCQQLISGWR